MYKIYPKNWMQGAVLQKVHKLLLIMKVTTLLLVIGIMQVSAASLAQRVTLTERNATLLQVFDKISNQTGYNFLFTGSDLKNAKRISIDVKNAALQSVLKQIFSNQPLNYTIENNSVVVSLLPSSYSNKFNPQGESSAQDFSDVGGTVTDSEGKPLSGASVALLGTKYATKADQNGAFKFTDVQYGNYVMVVTYLGYDKRTINIVHSSKDFDVNVILKRSISELDELQVVAYGSQSKRFNVGSVATVTAAEIEKQPITNPLLALQGQVPGLAITSASGVPGSQVMVQVRGQNTLNSNSLSTIKPFDQPLIIIDGVPFATQNNNVNQFASMISAQGGSANPANLSASVGVSPFNNINPSDIESISILKDADATSIYGSQGANGVILITTKKGKAGAVSLDVNVNTSFNSVGRPVKLLNTAQYLQLRKEAFLADGLVPSDNISDYYAYAPDLTVFDQNQYTDWAKEIYGKNTTNTNLHASLSGGTANNTFIISGGYNRSNFNYPGDFSDQHATLHSGLHHTSLDQKLTVDLTTDYGYGKNLSAGYGGANNVIFAPNLPTLQNQDGSLNWGYQGVDLTRYQFYASLLKPTNLENHNFNSVFHIDYKLMDGLSISANLGYNRNTTNENSKDPGIAQNPGNIIRTANFSNSSASSINIEPQLNYRKNIGNGLFTALIGGTYKSNPSKSSYITGSGYANDNLLGSINGVPEVSASDTYSAYKYIAAFARLNYIYNNKYILNLTGRRDGSSNFGPGHRYGNFGSIGAGWIFSEENTIKNLEPILSFGKVSASYGTSGSDGIAAYQYQALYKAIPYIPPFQGIGPSAPVNLYNPDYSWATKKALNIALDLGFLDNRLMFNATYYRNRESNQLVNYPLPIQSGIPSVLANLDATVQNRGFEFSLSSTNLRGDKFNWTSNFNLSFNRNKLVSFPGLEGSSYNSQYAIGKPTSIIYGYRYKGVNPNTGLFEFYKSDGTPTYTPNYLKERDGGDQTVIGDREINFMGGFGNTFSYKQFSLYIFCQFASQNAPSYLYQIYNSNQLGFMNNQPEAVLGQYWQKPGDLASLQRLMTGYGSPSIPEAGTNAVSTALNFGQSDGVYVNDTYLRVKTVSLSYSLSESLASKWKIKGASVFVNAQNLLTWTNYEVGDPEQPGSFTAFPIQRVVALGLNFKY